MTLKESEDEESENTLTQALTQSSIDNSQGTVTKHNRYNRYNHSEKGRLREKRRIDKRSHTPEWRYYQMKWNLNSRIQRKKLGIAELERILDE